MHIYCCCSQKYVNTFYKFKINPEAIFQRVLKVKKYADFEFRIYKFLILIFIVVVYKNI